MKSAAATSTPAHDRARPLRVVSVSQGSSTRDAKMTMTLLGREVVMERIGTDGNVAAAGAAYERLRDEVDAFGLGGADLDLVMGTRRWRIRESARLARHAGDTPVVCGAGLKGTLERRAIAMLDDRFAWHGRHVLLPSAVDRYGMAHALCEHGASVTLGDFAFLLGVPLRLTDLDALERWAARVAPLVVRLPMRWIYPTGARQESSTVDWRTLWFEGHDVVAGDYHLIARYAPERMDGTIVVTNTTTDADLAALAGKGVTAVATTTPRIDGRSLPTNLLEAAFVAVAGRFPLSTSDMAAMVEEAGLAPDVWTPRTDLVETST